jgi:kynurenine 3-monooxygenase
MVKKNISIVGGGLVGSLLSIYLSRRGHDVNVFERRADMRREEMSAGRSINLALSDRGIRALDEVGVMDDIRRICIPMHGRYIHNADGSTAFQPYGKNGQFINSVSRAELNKLLVSLAEKHDAKFHFNHRCTEIDWLTNTVNFETAGKKLKPQQSELIFAADGAYSSARLQHQLHHDRFQYSQYFIDYGYKELTIPPAANGEFALEVNALHIWPRGNYMLIALPNTDKSFTCTLFFPFEGEPSFATLRSPKQVSDFFKTTFTDAYPLMPTLTEDFIRNPTSSLVTIQCYPWVRKGAFALIGDAAHAMVPFFGQGMNCGFEDCSVLDALITKHNDNWNSILQEYQELRKPDADAISQLALDNFVEMRDKVADPRFLLQKKLEARLHEKYPADWIPAYSQVTFSPHIRYSEALRRGKKQESIMKEIMNEPALSKLMDDDSFLENIIKKAKE